MMNHLLVSWLMGTLFTPSAVAAEESHWLFRQFPETHTCQISTGERLAYPLHVYKAEQLALIGTVEEAATHVLLPANGKYRAVKFKVPGHAQPRAMVMIQAIDYLSTNLIPYREFLFNLMVEPVDEPEAVRGLSRFLADPFSLGNFGIFYMYKLYLNELLPTRSGWELGGWNKEFVPEIRYGFRGSDARTVTVRSEKGLVFEGSASFRWALPFAIPGMVDGRAITSQGDLLVRSVIQGHMQPALFDHKRDSFRLGEDPSARQLAEMGFRPFAWLYDTSFRMVVTSADPAQVPAVCSPK